MTLGTESPLRWVVTNDGSRRSRFTLSDELAPSLGAQRRRAGARLGPGSSATFGTTLLPTRRGRFTPRRVVFRTVGPLGLMRRQGTVDHPSTIRVHPAFPSREEAELRVRNARMLHAGMRLSRGIGGGTEFEQLREYGTDDEFRRIDWAASARVGKPIVRTYRPERNQNVIVLLDNGRLMAANVEDVPRLEHAMDAVMTVAAVASGLGDKVGLVTFDQDVRSTVPPAAHRTQVTRVAEAMFELESVLAESDYVEAFGHTLARFRRRSLLVLLTDLAPGAATDSLLPALPIVMRRHLVVIGAVRDPRVGDWAFADVNEGADVLYRRVAAVEAIAERDRVALRMQQMGATVIDVDAARLGAALADHYLKVKSTGLL
ncbi:MAG: DUF58 domain-containing protein [Microthrixaceae bacterium]